MPKTTAILFLALSLAACADDLDDGDLEEPITGFAPLSGFSGLVIVNNGDGRIHTGVLVANDIVITGSAVTRGVSASRVIVELAGQVDMTSPGVTRNASVILYHPDVDVAYLKLRSAFAIVNLPPLDSNLPSALVNGSPLICNGYNPSRMLTRARMEVTGHNDAAMTFDLRGEVGTGDSLADDDDGMPCTDNATGLIIGIARSTVGATHTQIAGKAIREWLPIAQQLFPVAAQSSRFALYNNLTTPMCADIAWGAYGEHQPVNQFPCHYGSNQLWYFDYRQNASHPMIVSAKTGMCLDIPSSVPGAALQTFHCTNVPNQQWAAYLHSPQGSGFAYVSSITAYGAWPIEARMNCLSARGGPSISSAPLEVRGCSLGTLTNTDQRWFLSWR